MDRVMATASAVAEAKALRATCPFYTYFPDEGPLRRELYGKHVRFLSAGGTWRQRLLLSANRSGKTATAAYELTCHLTGLYPPWWTGRRFDRPIEAWAAGDTSGTTRNIIQVALLGPTSTLESKQWAGMIPRPLVYDTSRKQGLPDAVSTIWVRHLSGGVSTLELLSYDQKREAFQGTTRAVVWLDEEPPADIYSESLIRTMTCDGLMIVTMTPLMGLTPFLAEWLERSVLARTGGEDEGAALVSAHSNVFGSSESAETAEAPDLGALSRYTAMITWDECPHLSDKAKTEMLREFPPYQREARSRGIPALGSGAIYPVPEREIRCDPFEIPAHWPRVWGADTDAGVGWTAAAWLAWDRDANVGYLYDVYKRRHAEPAVHIDAIKARGAWIPGIADAAGMAVTVHDSEQVIAIWRRGGLDVALPEKSLEAGIQQVWELLSAGRLKVFSSCGAFFDEYRLYRRDDKGRVVKQHDHVMDCCVGGETGVWTHRGVVPIRALVGCEGWCRSRNGVWARFLGARKVFEDVPVVDVSFADGSTVRCTPDHPFLTPRGWVRADALAGKRINRVPIVDETTPDSAMPDFVPTPVGARGVVRLAWTMWNTCAWSVTRCLQGIGMRRRSRAADRVACVSVTNAGQADVYCLTVPGLSAFAVGPSGVIVHNTRYVIQSGRARMKVRPLGTGGEKGGAQTGATDSGWMAQ